MRCSQLQEQEQDGGIEEVAVLLPSGGGDHVGWVLPPSGGPLEDSLAELLQPQWYSLRAIVEAISCMGGLVRLWLGLFVVKQQELGEEHEE